ncbi:MAG: HD domain-containing protein [Mariniblastus sp.]|nr:HD domain-containing protein [Mariniblastus sp.]
MVSKIGESMELKFDDLLTAAFFAAQKHRVQTRKDTQQTPYINHPLEVAKTLAVDGGVTDVDLLMAAMLHDTVEDTETSMEELAEHFGTRVAALVAEVTDDKSLTKGERKRLQVDQAPKKSDAAKQLKIADKICNARDIIQRSPAGWNNERKRRYLEWANNVVVGCQGVNAKLDVLVKKVIQDGLNELSE